MKKVFYFIRKGTKWYFDQASKTNLWVPSGTIPIKE